MVSWSQSVSFKLLLSSILLVVVVVGVASVVSGVKLVPSADLQQVDDVSAAAERSKREDSKIRTIALTALMCVLIGVLAAILQSVWITRPIRSLARQAEQISKGDYAQQIEIDSGDEVGHLALQFSFLARKNLELLIEATEKGTLAAELDLASAVQSTLVPDATAVDMTGISLAGYFNPAERVGGDWWNYYEMVDGRVLVIIGDVTGHGLGTAIISSAAQGAVITVLEQHARDLDLNKLLRAMNSAIFHAAKGRFVMTCFVSLFDPETRTITFANAGHNFPYHFDQEKTKINSLVARGTRLGDVRGSEFAVHQFQVKPSDTIIWYSDGIVECENAQQEPYGERRFRRVIIRSGYLESADSMRDEIIEDAVDYYGGYPQKDDVTLVIGRIG